MRIKAVIFDFIGTLTKLIGYSVENSENKMIDHLVLSSYKIDHKTFFEAYNVANQKYYEIRYSQLVEVTNAVWISEALNNLGCVTTPYDENIQAAVNIFFEDYLTALSLRLFAESTLRMLSQKFKIGLISNFTYAPVIYAALRRLGINGFFNAVIISEEVGWRKPDSKIFQKALRRLRVGAEETIFVGDSPIEDIEGAKNIGIEAVFIPSQFNPIEALAKTSQQPEHVIESLREIPQILL
ncbi:MAG: HAD family hydrolase [Candidatus Bathyarchaeota archaeon]|nr:MAG: HAD family hydrolase [Candidatus Bathyarchaeota archaeon]